MSAETLDLVRSYYDAFNARAPERLLALLADDVAHDVNQGRREVGKAAFRRFLTRMDRCYREQVSDLWVLASPDGARAAAEFTVAGTYLATDDGLPPARGQEYRLAAGAFFEVREDLITRVTNYYNLEDWLAQVAGG
ncbi:MAG: ketosteroid isomerase-related protein [Deferrisomatales bacterium]